jgi:transposase InsO family protein
LTLDAKVELVNAHREKHGLNACLRVLKVSKGLWHSRQKRQTLEARDAALKASIVSVIESHPDYGYRRIRAELRERGIRVNHKRLRRVLRSYELGLRRCLPASNPSPIQRLVKEAGSSSDLVKGRSFGILGAFSADFTEILSLPVRSVVAYGTKKAWWMALLDISSRWVGGWDDRLKKEEVGPSRNRSLALASLSALAEGMDAHHRDLEGVVIHHDQDSVYTSYAWLEEVLIERKAQVSFSEHGAKDNPWIESFWGRFKTENAGLCWEATTLDELRGVLKQQIVYYNTERRHSGLDYRRPEEALTRFIQDGEASANLSPN